MTRPRRPSRTWLTAWCSAAALFACGAVLADPPGRVARLAEINGPVSFAPGGEDEWVVAQENRPLITGDRVWADAGAHAELQIGAAAARIGSTTSVTLLNLDDRIAQIQLEQGTLNLRVRRVYPGQVYEIDAPNLAFSVSRPGDYRVDVDTTGNATIIRVRDGLGEAWGEGVAYIVEPNQQYTFLGQGLRDYSYDPMPPPDPFDNWTFDRDRREDAAVAARYVSPDVVGYSDLDQYGSWRSVEGYGNVWYPTQVAADWAPYRSGHWAWVDPWGWTWIDDAPWGFAPFHYGRWAYVSTGWCWVPGPIAVQPVYAPALVAFVGGAGGAALSIGGVAGIAWFALGPGDVYRPPYEASRAYFNNVNVSNTVVNTTVINNVYNNVNVTNIVYKNRETPGAVTAVSTTTFASAQPVAGHVLPVSRDVLARESVAPHAAVTPTRASVLAVGAVAAGAAAVAAARRPPAAVLSRPVVARTPPPPPPAPFAAQASLLAAQPGKPIAQDKLKALAPARTAEANKVKVVAPTVKPQSLSKEGAGKGLRTATPAPPNAPANKGPASAAVPTPPSAQERMLKENKGPPAASTVPQPPPSAQERMQRENNGAPAASVARPPAAEERTKKAPPPSEQERMQRENKGTPPAPAVRPPAAEERMKQAPPPSEQERMQKKDTPPAAAVRPPAAEERMKQAPPPPPAAKAPPQRQQPKEEEKATNEKEKGKEGQ